MEKSHSMIMLAALLLSAALAPMATAGDQNHLAYTPDLLPSNAQTGKCYARVEVRLGVCRVQRVAWNYFGPSATSLSTLRDQSCRRLFSCHTWIRIVQKMRSSYPILQ